MTTYHIGIVLKHDIEIDIPFKTFERNIKDFSDKHALNDCIVYATNSDGKFRAELKEKPEDLKEYILRISGWREGETLHIQRIYVSAQQESIYLQLLNNEEQQEARPIRLYDYVYDFLDLMETWAMDHKGVFYFEYIDGHMRIWDTYNIIKGEEKVIRFGEDQLMEVFDQWQF